MKNTVPVSSPTILHLEIIGGECSRYLGSYPELAPCQSILLQLVPQVVYKQSAAIETVTSAVNRVVAGSSPAGAGNCFVAQLAEHLRSVSHVPR